MSVCEYTHTLVSNSNTTLRHSNTRSIPLKLIYIIWNIYIPNIKCFEYFLPIHQATQNGWPKVVSWLNIQILDLAIWLWSKRLKLLRTNFCSLLYFATLLDTCYNCVVTHYSRTRILCIAYILLYVYIADIITVYAQHGNMVMLHVAHLHVHFYHVIIVQHYLLYKTGYYCRHDPMIPC